MLAVLELTLAQVPVAMEAQVRQTLALVQQMLGRQVQQEEVQVQQMLGPQALDLQAPTVKQLLQMPAAAKAKRTATHQLLAARASHLLCYQ
jgi:hypothetical protein